MVGLRILVHICCAPCFGYIHKSLTDEGHEIVGYFFNPNIHPYQEFLKRLQCIERYTALRPVEVIYDKDYNLDKYLVGALQAKYDPPPTYKIITKQNNDDGSFHDKIEVRDELQIKLKSKDESEALVSTIKTEESKSNTGLSDQEGNPDFKPRCGYCIGLRLAKTAEYAAKKGFDAFTTTLLESKYQPHEYIRVLGERLAAKYGIKFYYKDFRTSWKESIKMSKDLQLYRQQYCGCIFSEYERFGPE